MRFLHTADWHLGRSFYGSSLIEDQAYVLNQFIELAKNSKPSVVLISGDIYDRAVPPPDAVKLLDDVLTRLILELEIPVILIAGNHDSPLRIEFGARLMKTHRLYIYGTVTEPATAIQMYDQSGPICFYPLPYAEPAVLREYFGNDQIVDFETGICAWIEMVKANHLQRARAVLVSHAFIQGGEACESERRLSIGGG